jgi:glucan phosphoethanolaminetransferase (alkaline phosphatase superfamily)
MKKHFTPRFTQYVYIYLHIYECFAYTERSFTGILTLTVIICLFLIHKTLTKITLPLLTIINLNYTYQWSCLNYVILPLNEIHFQVKSVTTGRRKYGIEITQPETRYRMSCY